MGKIKKQGKKYDSKTKKAANAGTSEMNRKTCNRFLRYDNKGLV